MTGYITRYYYRCRSSPLRCGTWTGWSEPVTLVQCSPPQREWTWPGRPSGPLPTAPPSSRGPWAAPVCRRPVWSGGQWSVWTPSTQCYNSSLHFSFKNPDSKSGCSQSVVSAYLCVWLVSLSLWIRIRRLYRYMEISFPGWSQGKCNTKTPGTQEVTRGRRKMKWLGWVMTEHLPQCRLNCEQTIQVKNQIICDMCTCILIHHCIN